MGGERNTHHTQVQIQSIGSGGVGVGNLPDGRIVFVPRTAPGDRVRISLTREKKRWAEGRVEELLEASPHRRIPPCPLYDRCGGCALQHLIYSEQLRWKGRIVGDALRRIGGHPVEDPEVVPSPRELRYRNKISLTLRRLAGDRVVAGFHQLENPGRVLDIHQECLLPLEGLGGIWRRLREGWGPGASRLPGGRELRLTLRAEGEEGTLIIHGGGGNGNPGALLAAVTGLASIWRGQPGGGLRHLAGVRALSLSWLGEQIEVEGGAFLQANPEAGQILHRFVLDRCRDGSPAEVVEGYCGTGILGKTLAREGLEVVGIEMDPLSVAEARRDAPSSFRVVEGRVENHLADHLPAGLVILNPPRTGLEREVSDALRVCGPHRVIYVSCDPATLARDLERVGEAYRVEEVRSFDLFPQTGHVETVAVLEGGRG